MSEDTTIENKALLKDDSIQLEEDEYEGVELQDMNTDFEEKPIEETGEGPRSTAFDETETLEDQAKVVMQILIPVCITMLIVVFLLKAVSFNATYQTSPVLVYREKASDSGATKFLGSIINALIFVGIILVVTVLFVILYKYRCLKILYGWLIISTVVLMGGGFGIILYQLITQLNASFDWITFSLVVWNFAAVGFTSTFWHSAVKVNQFYMIAISVIMACIFTRLPEWTTWAILLALALYDLAAVLCPKGPLRMLVETAQERNEPIPALIYNASVWIGMAYEDDANTNHNEDESDEETKVDLDDEIQEEPKNEEEEEEEERRGVKLGLGDFVFYSVLVGRAALFDMLTVFTCFVAVITGLFITIMLLAIKKKALPALPFSIALGFIFYFLSRIFLVPFTAAIGNYSVVM